MFKNINFVLLAIVIIFTLIVGNVLFGCKCNKITENFEDVVMKQGGSYEEFGEKVIQEKLKSLVKTQNIEDIVEKAKKSAMKEVEKKEEEEQETETKANKETLSKKEMELFEAIKTDKMSEEELNKLVSSGVVNEDMIEKFLKNMDDDSDVVEGFSSCGRDYATY